MNSELDKEVTIAQLAAQHEREIARLLEREHVPYQSEAAAEGLHFDFVVQSGGDHPIYVEAKFIRDSKNIRKALPRLRNEMSMLARFVEGRVYAVLNDPPTGSEAPLPANVVYISQFESLLRQWRLAGTAPGVAVTRSVRPNVEVFVAMPFADEFNDVYNIGIRQAARGVRDASVGVYRVDHGGSWGDVMADIKAHIHSSVFVVADLSGAQANVMFEYGYAMAVPRRVIGITSTPVADAPFDVSHDRLLKYQPHDTNDLRRRLTREFRTLLRELGHIPPPRSRASRRQ